jgi:colanic acid/amylovoran biosynthesis protein
MEQYYALIQKLCEKLFDKGFDIEFISTCQGIKDYVDDSKTASLISDAILQKNADYASRINIVTSFHTYFELTDLLKSRYWFVVGTRLHMCILSLINGIPAFNISYEEKECYEYLNLSDYSVDFNEPALEALRKFDLFLTN